MSDSTVRVKEDGPEAYRTVRDQMLSGVPISWDDFCSMVGIVDEGDHLSLVVARNQVTKSINKTARRRRDGWRLVNNWGEGVTKKEGEAMVNEVTKRVYSQCIHAFDRTIKEMERMAETKALPEENTLMAKIVLSSLKNSFEIARSTVDVIPVADVRNHLKRLVS